MRSGKWPRRAALVAVCLGASAAFGTATAAAATVSAENIYGMGSSLQAIAQTNSSSGGEGGYPSCPTTGWNGWVAVWDCSFGKSPNYQSTLSNQSVANYNVESSGVGLAEFGNAASSSCTSTTGVLSPACDPVANVAGSGGTPELDSFIGTDDPPNSTQLGNASTAAGAGVQEITLPVAQAPVALLISLPSDIKVATGGQVKLTSQEVADIYSHAVPAESSCVAIDSSDAGNTWCDILVEAGWTPITTGTPTGTKFLDSGTDNGGAPIIQVRSKGSGTTYSIRGYLYELDKYGQTTDYPYSLVNDGLAGGVNDWPIASFTTTTNSNGGANGSGGQLVANTENNPGSFGYANLADAEGSSLGQKFTAKAASYTTNLGASTQILWALVQDNTTDATPNYVSPSNSTGTVNLYTGTNIGQNVSTCAAPNTARVVGCWVVPATATGAWSSSSESTPGTIPSDADVYDHGTSSSGAPSKTYPIVATTYDVFWTDYDNASSNMDINHYYNDPSCPTSTNCNTDAGQAAKSFAAFLTGAGQSKLASAKVYYGALPSAIKTKAASFAKSVTP